jgi:hypothetical protein
MGQSNLSAPAPHKIEENTMNKVLVRLPLTGPLSLSLSCRAKKTILDQGGKDVADVELRRGFSYVFIYAFPSSSSSSA